MKPTVIAILLILIGTTGCVAPGQKAGGVMERVQEIADRYRDRQREIQTGNYGGQNEVINVTGDWQLAGSNNINRIRHTRDGIMVTPVGRGQSVFYREIGVNLYELNSATYDFSTIHNGVWYSNDKRNLVIHLRRMTWN